MIQRGLHQASDKFTVPDHSTGNGQTYSDATTHGDEHWTLAGTVSYTHLDVYKRQAVIVSAIVLICTGWVGFDAVAGGIIALMMIPRAIKLLRNAVRVLLEETPNGLDLDEVRAHLEPVSYTHLDVYKRQLITRRLPPFRKIRNRRDSIGNHRIIKIEQILITDRLRHLTCTTRIVGGILQHIAILRNEIVIREPLLNITLDQTLTNQKITGLQRIDTTPLHRTCLLYTSAGGHRTLDA